MPLQQCRWGILGTANIARKNWQAIHNSGNATLSAVASRESSKAEKFILDLQQQCPYQVTPSACTYEELLARKDVDAVYIPLPTGLRKDWVIRAAQAGKHVLCEKPCAVSNADLQEMVQACRDNRVQFMDGVMFMHSQRLPLLRESLSQLGTLRRMQFHFSFLPPDEFFQSNIRAQSQFEPQGCAGDLGWYCIRMALWIMNETKPVAVAARMLDQIDGVPMELTAELTFENGVTSGFYCSFRSDQQQTMTVSGSNGYLKIDDFVLPFFGNEAGLSLEKSDFQISGCQFNMAHRSERKSVPEFSNNHVTSQETRLFRTFSNLVLSGTPDPVWSAISQKTQRVLDACLQSAQKDGATVAIPRN